MSREAGELEKVWDGVLGRYDRAVRGLVADALCESQDPVEKLLYAVRQMKTPESGKRALEAVQKGSSLDKLDVLHYPELNAASTSVPCLTALLRELEGIHSLGHLLEISEATLAAIDAYYDDTANKINHLLTVWLMEDPDDPVKQLRDALNSLGKDDISQTLVLLSSLGNSNALYIKIRITSTTVMSTTDENAKEVTLTENVDVLAEGFSGKGRVLYQWMLPVIYNNVMLQVNIHV